MPTTSDRRYGNASWTEKVTAGLSVGLYMPIVLAWTLLASPFHEHSRSKTWTRVLGDKTCQYLTQQLSTEQIQWLTGNTRTVYEGWMKQNGLPILVDELAEDTRLLWIGKQGTDRVILYFHGGAFLFPMSNFMASFWKYFQAELKKKNVNAGIAILNYTLAPSATFPTQLKQAVVAVEHLMSIGVQPQNIQIVGDSAGANLALQLISHILHPLSGVRPLVLPSPIRGVYLMSPWVLLTGAEGSMTSNDGNDIIGPKCINMWGHQVLDCVLDSQLPYIEAAKAPELWFKAMDTAVGRVLITAGSAECLRDSIEVFGKQICSIHGDAMFWMQENGVHNDPFLDFLSKEKVLGKMTSQILEWFAAGFSMI